MICKKCGTENLEENEFCSKCGKKLKSKNKMDSKKKKVIIILSSITILIIIVIGIFVCLNNRNKEIYKNATNKFITLNFKEAYSEFGKIESYKNAKHMKQMCISQAEETANSMIESKNYEQAIELYSFIGEHKDSAENIKKLKEEYLNYLLENNEEEKAYNYLTSCSEISQELKHKVQVEYIIDLMYNDQYDQGIELMNNIENITDSDKNKIVNAYIKASAYTKAYNSLYNSMRNPSSLNVRGVSYTLYCSDENGNYKASGYDKETGNFKIQVKFSFSGQNGFGGMSSDTSTYIYTGNINLQTMKLELNYYMNY